MKQPASYDIVICGGGTAGCVLAYRLSEDPGLKILLLESGSNQNENPMIKTPGFLLQTHGDPATDYDFHSIPQPGLDGKVMGLVRGKGIGGSSLVNYMAMVYPSKSGIDMWQDLGNPGWDFASMQPYLKKFQKLHMPGEQLQKDLALGNIDLKSQGSDGPIQVSFETMANSKFDKAWIETIKNLNLAMVGDTMSGENWGGYQIASTIDPVTGQRSHAGTAYWEKARHRPNLETVTNAVVDKVLFTEDSTPSAKAVQYIHEGNTFVVEASQEVILCSGALGTPPILERSGIGNPSVLAGQNIHPIVPNTNVGENLQDHIMAGVAYEVQPDLSTNEDFRDPAYLQAAITQFETHHNGPLAKVPQNFAYMPLLDQGKHPLNLPALLDKHVPEATATPPELFTRKTLLSPNEACANLCILMNQAHLEHLAVADTFAMKDDSKYITFMSALCHPLSRGNVHIYTANPAIKPTYNPNYYSHPLDLEIIALHIPFFDRVVATPPLNSLIKPQGKRIPSWVDLSTDAGRKKLAKRCCMSNQHPCGTAAMLPREKGGVVDARLMVYGVGKLRVVDASIFPIIPRGNLISMVYAVAEKASDMIKEDSGKAKAK